MFASHALLQMAGSAARGHSIKVGQIMTPSVLTISDTSTVQQAALLMAQKGIGVLPVTDDKGSKMTGMLTDRDITVRACAAGMDPRSTLVESIKTSETPRYVFEDEPIDHVAHNMAAEQVRRLPVMSRDKRLVGIVALSDITSRLQLRDKDAVAGEALAGIAQPAGHHQN